MPIPLFRSEEMRYVEISVVRDKARPLLSALGRRSMLHLIEAVQSEDGSEDGDNKANKEARDLRKRIVECAERHKILNGIKEILERFDVRLSDGLEEDQRTFGEQDGFMDEDDDGGALGGVRMKTVGRRGGGPAARQRDTLQEFDESINEFHNEINSNLSLLRALKAQESKYREAREVLTLCTNDYLKSIGEEIMSDSSRPSSFHSEDDASEGLLARETPRKTGRKESKRRRKSSMGELNSLSLHGEKKHTEPFTSETERSRSLNLDQIFNPQYEGARDVESGLGLAMFYACMCGTIPISQERILERSVFRVSRGNAICRFIESSEDFYEADSDRSVRKVVFTIITSGERLPQKLAKVCRFLNANLFEVPSDAEPYIFHLTEEIDRQRAVLRVTELRVRKLLRRLAGPYDATFDSKGNFRGGRRGVASVVRYWEWRLERDQRLSRALTKCRRSPLLVSFSGWVPAGRVQELHSTVDPYTDGDSRVFLHVQGEDIKGPNAKRVRPTYFKLNKWTAPFQGIVDTYGIARYKEINPGMFTIVTFPFCFGVMYGDMGHGLALFLGAVYLILRENSLEKEEKRGNMSEIMSYAFNARYALLPMGMFALYCGSIYNDCLSVPIPLFDSSWAPPSSFNSTRSNATAIFSTAKGGAYRVYPYGVDPSWYNSNNELAFFNSLKMKMSVIFGVVHMLLGIFLNALNHIYNGDRLSLVAEWIPRVVFMTSTFGYMCLLIIIKWSTDYGCQNGDSFTLSCPNGQPPSLIQMMIKMFLSPGTVPNPLYEGQAGVQVFLILLAVASVPVMLFAKPLILSRRTHRSRRRGDYESVVEDSDNDVLVGSHDEDSDHKNYNHFEDEEEDHRSDQDHSFGEMMIHQGIHTIEYVLGCVSNTASYLRLWALSLAHAQLASVFWEKFIVEIGLESENPIYLVGAFAVWAFATFAVLLCMDLLECFLHALRLHWVEFQNKFYMGDGIKFDPFALPIEPPGVDELI